MTTDPKYALAILILGICGVRASGGEASTSASAGSGWGRPGTAAATAHYDGGSEGFGIARTRTQTGQLNLARGLAVGLDADGLDFSFSHAIAPQFGPAYAGTFNLSIGLDGDVSGSYGGVLAQGGLNRSVQAGGSTRTDGRGAIAQAVAHGDTSPGGTVVARTHSYSQPVARAYYRQPVRIQRYSR